MNSLEKSSFVRCKYPWQELDGNVLILQSDKYKSHELNESCSFIWKSLDTQKSFNQICNLMEENFDVPSSILLEDLKPTLELLVEKSLIRIIEN